MSAGTPERQRVHIVERAIDAIARIDEADRIDAREDAAIARIPRSKAVPDAFERAYRR